MSDFKDFDLEISDEKDSDPEHFSGSVAFAGTPITISPSNGKRIQLAFVHTPGVRAPTPNSVNDALLVTIDGSSNRVTLMSGDSQYFPGVFDEIKLDTNNNGTIYEVILWS